ncbi:MAG: hypothetical protein ACOCQP_03660, partial [Lentisphaeria bacterium]
AFVALTVVQNFWRPVLVGRCAALSERDATATVLSVDAQTRAVFAAVLAPLIGWGVDIMAGVNEGIRFLPVALVGMIVCSVILLTYSANMRSAQSANTSEGCKPR